MSGHYKCSIEKLSHITFTGIHFFLTVPSNFITYVKLAFGAPGEEIYKSVLDISRSNSTHAWMWPTQVQFLSIEAEISNEHFQLWFMSPTTQKISDGKRGTKQLHQNTRCASANSLLYKMSLVPQASSITVWNYSWEIQVQRYGKLGYCWVEHMQGKLPGVILSRITEHSWVWSQN